MKRLSIIIVTYNSEKDIYDCISSIYQHTDLPISELEIIVVDNNSKETDNMFANIQAKYGSDIILIKNTHNGGYGQGNNVGIRQATAPVIMIMNPDVRMIEPVFKTAVEAFNKSPKLSIYGMKQMLTESVTSNASFDCIYMMNGYISTLITGICNRLGLYIPKYMYFSGSCFFIRKEMFESVGLFDESIFMYGEEDDIHYRITKKYGTNMAYNHKLHYIHKTLGRKPDIKFEQKLLDVAISQNEKRGYSAKKTIKNKLRSKRVLLYKEKIKNLLQGKGNSSDVYDMLKLYTDDLKKRLENG